MEGKKNDVPAWINKVYGQFLEDFKAHAAQPMEETTNIPVCSDKAISNTVGSVNFRISFV